MEDMCLQNMAERLYDRLQNECERHIDSSLDALTHQTHNSLAFLELMRGCWSAHCDEMHTLRSVFLYLDRTYVMQTPGKKSLWQSGIQIFRTHLTRRPEVCVRVRNGLLLLIEKERMGDQIDRSLLHALLRMLYDLSMYPQHFEQHFLEATNAFYRKEAAALLEVRINQVSYTASVLYIKCLSYIKCLTVSHNVSRYLTISHIPVLSVSHSPFLPTYHIMSHRTSHRNASSTSLDASSTSLDASSTSPDASSSQSLTTTQSLTPTSDYQL